MEPRRIPNSLKKYRRLAGYSQTQVAQVLGLKRTACISRWEKGLSFPPAEYLFRLSFIYKTIPNHLYMEICQKWKDESLCREQLLLAPEEPF
jgi:transcriptional regulator with XRE-family HTH domain